MTTPEDAIRARRRLTNKLIAGREAARLRPFFVADARLITGDGGLILGADAIVEAFAAQFREPGFVAYMRTPERIEPDADGARAAETGRWTGLIFLSIRWRACRSRTPVRRSQPLPPRRWRGA